MSWYNNDAAFKNESSSRVRRFWIKNNTDREITFVDGPSIDFNGTAVPTPLKYQEYNLNMNGHWRNWFTKPTDASQDFLSELGNRASKVAVLTIIDHSEWTDRKGDLHKDELLLYVVKRSSTVWKQIERFYQAHGCLQGQRFRISRMGDKSPGAGSLLEHIGPSEVYNPELHTPYDYFEILKPKTKEELIKITSPDQDDFSQPQQHQTPPQQHSQSAWGGYQSNTPQNTWNTQPPQQPQQPQQPPSQYGYAKDSKIPF